jgi:nitrogen fixation NifU-like protein
MENIIDLYKNPLNQGELDNASTTHRAHNPLCGDEVTIDLLIKDEKIEDVRQRGVGCAISQASVSLLTDEIKGMSLKEVMGVSKDDVIDMLGIELGPVRLKCALIGLEAIHEAIKKFINTTP